MQKYFEKIIEMLEESKTNYKTIRSNTHCRRTETNDCDSCRADHYLDARLSTIKGAIEIVNQVAEEYSKDINVGKSKLLDSLHEKILKSKFAEEVTEAEIEALVRAKELTNINQSLTNDGWIPVSSGKMPEEKENPVTSDWYVYPVMVKFEEITDIRYYSFGNGHWHHGPGIMDKYVTHWMDITPYQPKGE